MANERLNIIIDATFRGKGGIEQAGREMKKLDENARKAGEGTRYMQQKFATAMTGITAGVVAAGAVFKKTWDMVGEGAGLSLAEDRLDRLAGKVGSTSDAILADFGKATGGMMSQSEMVASASQIIELGLAGTAEEVVRLGNVAGQLGLDQQQLIMTFANDSKMRLDSLGLSVSDVEARTKAYTDAGVDASKAFDLAVLDALEARLGTLGSAVGTTTGAVEQLEATWQNLTDEGKQWMALRLSGPIVGLANTMTAVSEASDKGHSSLRNMVVVMAELGRMGDQRNVFDVWAESLEESEQKNVDASSAAKELTEGLKEQAVASTTIIRGMDAAGDATTMYADAAQDAALASVRAYAAQRDYEQVVAQWTTTMSSAYSLEAMYGQAAQLSATQSANAGLKIQFRTEQQEALNAVMVSSFIAFTENEDALKQYENMMAGVLTTSTQVGGRTEEQNEQLEHLQDAYDRASQSIADYQAGIKGVGMSEERRNEEIAEQQEIMANAQAAMEPLLGIQDEYVAGTDGGRAATEAMNDALYAQIEASTDDAEMLALAGVALGQFSEAQGDAMLKAALLEEAIRKQAEGWDGTAAGLLVVKGNLQSYIDTLNNMPSLIETEVKTKYTTEGTPVGVPEGHTGGVAGGSGRAAGGPVTAGGMYTVGERGPELFIPNTSGNIVPNGQTGGGGNTVIVNVYGGMAASPTAIAGAVSKVLTPRG